MCVWLLLFTYYTNFLTTRTTAVDRRSTPSARADRQEPLPMFRCPGSPGFP
jgi:hypothetical protein